MAEVEAPAVADGEDLNGRLRFGLFVPRALEEQCLIQLLKDPEADGLRIERGFAPHDSCHDLISGYIGLEKGLTGLFQGMVGSIADGIRVGDADHLTGKGIYFEETVAVDRPFLPYAGADPVAGGDQEIERKFKTVRTVNLVRVYSPHPPSDEAFDMSAREFCVNGHMGDAPDFVHEGRSRRDEGHGDVIA